MKKLKSFAGLAMVVSSFFVAAGAFAVEFTTDTTIGPLDTTFDGADIIVSNCAVTINGAHVFNSVLLTNGGVLTHSYLPNGMGALVFNVVDEEQTLNGTNPVTLLNSNILSGVVVTDTGHTVTYTNDVDYVQTNLADGTTQIYRTETSSIPDGATVLVSYTWSYSYSAGLFLTVSNDFTVSADSSINANGAGYGPALGGGRGFTSASSFADGSGAGHAGIGGMSSSNALGGFSYDLVFSPVYLGSGGGASYVGPGGAGGGHIQITAGGSVTIDGLVSANGNTATNSRAGGGAGGSIWIVATNFSGAGAVTANGGAGEPIHGGGGGGGMISLRCSTNLFTGNMTAFGGSGWEYGGAGTVWVQTNGATALLLVDNGGHLGTNSTFVLTGGADVLIRGGAGVRPNGTFTARNLTISTNSVMAASSQTVMNLAVSGDLIVRAGGAVLMDSLGYAGGTGSGHGGYFSVNPYPTGGGGYGGIGGIGGTNAIGGITYGLPTSPATFGSGAGIYNTSYGGAGGGALQLNVTGILQVDGSISANGGDGSGTGGGGGSGGGLYLNVGAIIGSGSITADGGNGVAGIGGGGGGGRIAVYAFTNTFSGTISAAGGGGANYGGAGTIYMQPNGGNDGPQLILDNAGHLGTNTPLSSLSSATLVVRNGAKASSASSGISFNNLLVASNGWLVHVPGSSLNLTFYGSATIQPGGGFMGDFCGRIGGQGFSYGGSYYLSSPYNYYVCGGGSYGGKGGSSIGNYASGGSYVGDTAANPSPSYSGSGGGSYYSPYIGGNGGGFLQMNVYGTLQNDGIITANGGNGSGIGGGGGGAGGGVYLTLGKLSGSGTISANGGNGANNLGGGGGGGRIAIYFTSNNFTGTLSAFGGGGANWGGAGTIFLKTNTVSHAQVIADNGGNPGAGTFWTSSTITDFILRNGSSCNIYNSVGFGDLVVGTNAWLIASNTSPTITTISAANVTVQPGGGITADSAGYNANSSYTTPATVYAQPPYYQGGGGGHGGAGGYAFSGSGNGGAAFDNGASAPSYGGGGGGGNTPYSIGGKGGGAIGFSINGTLQVDGSISANGGNGDGTGGGGGAGGGLSFSCYTLKGSGNILANGGNGVTVIGGGGAGGMIYGSFTSNSYSGNFSAYGGSGYRYGGAGTILLKTNTTGHALVIIDNGNHAGMSTPIPLTGLSHVVLRGGANAYFNIPSTTITSLLIQSNAWLSPYSSAGSTAGSITLTINGDATVKPGGYIYADAAGYSQNIGAGHGGYSYLSSYYPCTGGAHGGYGAMPSLVSNGSFINNSSVPFDSTTAPVYVGSGGGGYSSYSTGGSGGGYVRMTVNGTLQVDGNITANGGNGFGNGGGGGSGGGIYLTPATLAGSGSISANGGNGAIYGGGGGGGRIAVYFNNNNFTGSISAYGGGGYAFGGAGTVYTKTNNQQFGQLLLDNNNNTGTNTGFEFSNFDVIVQNGAAGVLPPGGAWSPHNVLIRTNGALNGAVSPNSILLSVANLTIDDGGALALDGTGYSSANGPGGGYASAALRGGGGYGGYGGGNFLVSRGLAYGSITAPTSAGSGGGSYQSPPYNPGGYGGGALRLSVIGLLTVNGRLSANGGNGDNYAGGGSGGSLYFSSVNQIAGSGLISANGGTGGSASGGGAGGRIALICNSNGFTGQISAAGGDALFPGGAGTVYTVINGIKTLTVDNDGINGTNTPLDAVNFSLPTAPFNLNISGAAKVVPVTPLPLVSNLNLAVRSTILAPVVRTQLVIAVQHDANLAGIISMDNLGFAQASGPGSGTNISLKASGGGYGGAGGNSANGAPGGGTYGSASQPVDFGSGGGYGANPIVGGSEGGGALRISVGGTLNIDGTVSANGDYGWQDDSGGGAGGSIWITANSLTGLGTISVAGGNGDLWNGGGGGGGRIAIYAPTNLFAGITNVDGGWGAYDGQSGTVFLSSTPLQFQIVSQSPSGIVSNTVSSVDLHFNEVLDPASVSAADFTVTTPAGVLPSGSLGLTVLDTATVRVSFPLQNLIGDYSIQSSTSIQDLFGLTLSSPYTGGFTISLPTISGMISDTNGTPVEGVLVQPSGGLNNAITDASGYYSIGVPPGWNGTLTPSFSTFVFVPGAANHTNVTQSLTNQNFVMYETIAPNLSSSLSGTNLNMNWFGINGVNYQAWSSTNLVDWVPYGDVIPGTNGLMQLFLPLDGSPAVFVRVQAAN